MSFVIPVFIGVFLIEAWTWWTTEGKTIPSLKD